MYGLTQMYESVCVYIDICIRTIWVYLLRDAIRAAMRVCVTVGARVQSQLDIFLGPQQAGNWGHLRVLQGPVSPSPRPGLVLLPVTPPPHPVGVFAGWCFFCTWGGCECTGTHLHGRVNEPTPFARGVACECTESIARVEV